MRIKRPVLIILVITVMVSFGFGDEALTLNKGVKSLDFLSDMEQEVVRELNRVRTDPAGYAAYLEDFKRFYVGRHIKIAGQIPIVTREGVSAVIEAIKYLKQAAPVGSLSVSRGLSKAARSHVKDQGPKGSVSHEGSDGSSPYDRMFRYGKIRGAAGENVCYGEYSARQVVMQLIIDDGVPDRGHRVNVFKPDFHTVGVAFGDHKSFTTMCVIDFADVYIEQ